MKRVSCLVAVLLASACGEEVTPVFGVDGAGADAASGDAGGPPDTPSPESSDLDGDGLSDAEEAERGTDPLVSDTDGDGYLDYDEVIEGSDPLDATSWIYLGHWPYYRDKDSIEAPEFGPSTIAGPEAQVPRFVAVDQHGQEVDLYDFAYQGREIVIDMSTLWCEPCKRVARWIAGEPGVDFSDRPWWREEYRVLRRLVAEGHIYWITIIYEYEDHSDAGEDAAALWDALAPNPLVPVLSDTDKEMHAFIRATGIPNCNLLSEDLSIRIYSSRGLTGVFEYLLAEYAEELAE